MRFFHLSDIHIGIRLHEYDLAKDQKEVLQQVISYAKEYAPDAVVIAGDIYDKSLPSAEAVQMFHTFIAELHQGLPENTVIMIISGNHDSAERIDYMRSLLALQGVYMVGMPPRTKDEHIACVTLQDEYGPVHFYLLPFVKPYIVREVVEDEEDQEKLTYNRVVHKLLEREKINCNERNVIVSHQFYIPTGANPDLVERMENETTSVGNIDAVFADVLEPYDYAALGHIHKAMKVGEERFRYCGTPMTYSVSEAGQNKSLLMVDMSEKNSDLQIQELPLLSSRKVRKLSGTVEELIKMPSEDYVSITLTDKKEYDSFGIQEKMYHAFPNLLELRRDYNKQTTKELSEENMENMKKTTMELFEEFYSDMSPEEKEILADVINEVRGQQE